LAAERPIDEIRLSDVAREAGVSWPTVKRHVGDREKLKELIERDDLIAVDTRARLLTAAERVFAARGYDAATLDEIAAEAGLTKGAVYWHFESKQDLFVTLLGVHGEAGEARQATTGIYQLLLGLGLGRAQLSRNWARLALEFAAQSRAPEIGLELDNMVQERTQAASAIVSALQAEGVLDPELDPEQVARLLSAVARGLVLLSAVDPRLELSTFVPEVARLFERALKR
jgi:TetR/AcrR family acrAB operon transcriptional repressor